jgi:superfamily II RNA helicase
MLFNGLFNTLSPPVVAALLSCFVFDPEKKAGGKGGETDATAQLPPALLKVCFVVIAKRQKLKKQNKTGNGTSSAHHADTGAARGDGDAGV